MKKLPIILFALCLFSSQTKAGEPIELGDYTINYSGLVGGYYGIMQTKKINNVDNLPNRWVLRGDAKFGIDYKIDSNYTITLDTASTLQFREHDTARRNGDWRFYPVAKLKTPLGTISLGNDYNVAYLGHKGAKDITYLKIVDSNLTSYLSNPNWNNGKKSVSHLTAKSTQIMNDGRATKLNYITPQIGNSYFGFSYIPDNAHRRGMTSRYADYQKTQDGYVFAINSKFEHDFANIYTSIGYGFFNRTDKELSLGLTIKKGKFNIASGYKKAYIDGNDNPITTTDISDSLPAYFDNYREGFSWDMSMGYDFGKFKSNIGYIYSEAENTRNNNNLFLLSNVYNLKENIELYGILGYINAKGMSKDSNDNNKGYAIITGIGLKF